MSQLSPPPVGEPSRATIEPFTASVPSFADVPAASLKMNSRCVPSSDIALSKSIPPAPATVTPSTTSPARRIPVIVPVVPSRM